MPGPVFLEGDAVELRTVEEEDLPYLQAEVNRPEVRIPIARPGPVNATQERQFFDDIVSSDESTDLLIARAGEPMGMISLNPIRHRTGTAELGYWLSPDEQGRGYTTEAAALLLGHGFDQLALHRVHAHVYGFNEPSRRLLTGLGFTHEGTLREHGFVDGERVDLEVYGLLRREWDNPDGTDA
ncbi:MAG: GNAT family N-acetyltransferase [Halobacteriota archaeon]